MAKSTKTSDAENTGFGIRENIVKHKPGFDLKAPSEEEGAGNRRFRPSEKKDVPQQSLAERIAKTAKGG